MSDGAEPSRTDRQAIHPIVVQMAPSAEQLPAILARGRDVVVTAGAGTGKTRTLVGRYLSLLADGLPLRSIVAITFTNKAAREMRNRVREEMQRYLNRSDLSRDERRTWQQRYAELDGARIGTIHSLCAEILRAHPAEARIDPLFGVLEEGQANLLRGEAVRETMAWAADTPGVVGLFAVLGERGLQAMLDTLLQRHLEVREAFQRAPADRLGDWRRALNARQEVALTALLADETWRAAIETLEAHAARVADDGLEMMRRQALAAIDEATGTVAERLASLGGLDAINLARGSKGAWLGGAEERETVKEALQTVRSAWRERAALLGLALTPADTQLAAVTPALEAAFDYGLKRYQSLKEERNALDFDDLEWRALDLLEESADVRCRWQDEVGSLLVDEFQDTNGRQRDLVRLLNGDRTRLFIVGDAKQSIYRFRGADVAVFREEHERAGAGGGALYALSTSYRAHRGLLRGLNTLLRPVLGEEADPSRPWVEPFSPLEAAREEAGAGIGEPHIEFHLTVGSKKGGALERAADALAGRLVALVEGGDEDEGGRSPGPLGYGDIAILCRASTSFGVYEDALERAGVPFLTVAGRGFYSRPEIRDLLNALQALADPTDDLALVGLLRSPVLGVSDVTIFSLCRGRSQRLWDVVRQERLRLHGDEERRVTRAVEIISELNQRAGRSSVSDLLKGFLDRTDYRAALIRAEDSRGARNVSKLLADAQASGIVSAGEFLEYINGLRESGTREGEARAAAEGAVQIMSIHAAKGLEFPIVVIGDVTKSGGGSSSLLVDRDLGVLLPLKEESETAAVYRLAKLRNDDQEAAEADRLLYVAATRAREKLLLSGCVGQRQDGRASRMGRWLEALATMDGFDLADAAVDHREAGEEARALDWVLEGSAIRCVVYEPGYGGPRAAQREAGVREERLELPPPLLGPVVRGEAGVDERREGRGEMAPGRVVGSLVHAALAAWRFPEDGFDEWATARARGYGMTEAGQLRQVVEASGRLLARLREDRFYETLAGAERRLHEVPYSLMVDGRMESGVIDVVMQAGGEWTVVEFKTNRVANEAQLRALMVAGGWAEQAQRYGRAVGALLGGRPRCLVCLLDYGGAVRVESVPAVVQNTGLGVSLDGQ